MWHRPPRAPRAGTGARRLAAWVVDWLVIAAYAAALVPVGLAIGAQSWRLSPTVWNAISFAILVVPVTMWLAWWERGPAAAGVLEGVPPLKLEQVKSRAATSVTHVTYRVLS